MTRRAGDRYLTPDSAFRVLLDRADEIRGSVLLDPASGDGRGAERVGRRFQRVVTNDLDPASPAEHHYDATGGDGMALWLLEPSWVVTNPPYSHASEVARLALQYSTRGVALLLRCTWLEPCRDREWLAETPPTRIIALPRISFTGQGSDSAPAWWCIWTRDRPLRGKPGAWLSGDIEVVTRAQLRAYEGES